MNQFAKKLFTKACVSFRKLQRQKFKMAHFYLSNSFSVNIFWRWISLLLHCTSRCYYILVIISILELPFMTSIRIQTALSSREAIMLLQNKLKNILKNWHITGFSLDSKLVYKYLNVHNMLKILFEILCT